MRRVQIYLREDQLPALKRVAHALSVHGKSAVIRLYIDEGLARDKERRAMRKTRKR